MIVAAGLTPAWQQILRFTHFQPGEVNRAVEAHWCGSGKVLNVGIAIHHLGAKVRTLAPLGGQAAAAIGDEFVSLGVPARWVTTSAATRVCTTILDQATNTTTELVENARPLSLAELNEFQAIYRAEIASASCLVLAGSLPVRTPVTWYHDLLAETVCPAVIDARGPELLAALSRRPLVVKPNAEELARTVGRALPTDEAIVDACEELRARGAQWVAVSQGQRPLWLVGPTGAQAIQPPQCDEVVNPIGCGDCLAAGIAVGVASGLEVPEAVCLGMAAAHQNLGQLLPARLDKQTVAQLAEKIAAAQLRIDGR